MHILIFTESRQNYSLYMFSIFFSFYSTGSGTCFFLKGPIQDKLVAILHSMLETNHISKGKCSRIATLFHFYKMYLESVSFGLILNVELVKQKYFADSPGKEYHITFPTSFFCLFKSLKPWKCIHRV